MSTVLVVEDDRACQRVIEGYLKRAGYRVLVAASGEAGLALARAGGIDVVTLDVRMRPIDGWAVFKALRDDAATQNIPIVFVTIVEHAIVGRRLGAEGYIGKPFRGQQLVEVVAQALRDGAAKP
jgi:DNA-binding response OmpR family regulator